MPGLETVIGRMRGHFGADQRRIDHALKVLGFARRIQAAEGGDRSVVELAAVLHDIGITEAERKHGSSAGHLQELEGPPLAAAMLADQGLATERLGHVLTIIANHHSARCPATAEFKAVWDADWLVNLPEEADISSPAAVEAAIRRIFKTTTGAAIARELHATKPQTGDGGSMATNLITTAPYADTGFGARKLAEDPPHLLLMQVALKPGQQTPRHQANANARIIVLTGEISGTVAGAGFAASAGDLLYAAQGDEMEIRNQSNTNASFMVIKSPHPGGENPKS